MTDEEELAALIWRTSREDEGTISATGANIIARTLLRSGYMLIGPTGPTKRAYRQGVIAAAAVVDHRRSETRWASDARLLRLVVDEVLKFGETIA
jgi:hypothetical protein